MAPCRPLPARSRRGDFGTQCARAAHEARWFREVTRPRTERLERDGWTGRSVRLTRRRTRHFQSRVAGHLLGESGCSRRTRPRPCSSRVCGRAVDDRAEAAQSDVDRAADPVRRRDRCRSQRGHGLLAGSGFAHGCRRCRRTSTAAARTAYRDASRPGRDPAPATGACRNHRIVRRHGHHKSAGGAHDAVLPGRARAWSCWCGSDDPALQLRGGRRSGSRRPAAAARDTEDGPAGRTGNDRDGRFRCRVAPASGRRTQRSRAGRRRQRNRSSRRLCPRYGGRVRGAGDGYGAAQHGRATGHRGDGRGRNRRRHRDGRSTQPPRRLAHGRADRGPDRPRVSAAGVPASQDRRT
jgi:hypothetical protein